MIDRVLIPLPGIGTLSLTRAEYDAALIPIPPPETLKPVSTPPPIDVTPPRRQGLHYIRLPEVCSRVGLRPSSLYRLIQLGRFPKQVKLSERSSAWIESEIEAFMDARIAERNRQTSGSSIPASPYLRMGEVMKRTGFNHEMIYDGVRNGTFPKWADLPKRASEWLKTDVEAWLAARDHRKN
jgi:prophage regulatory protein